LRGEASPLDPAKVKEFTDTVKQVQELERASLLVNAQKGGYGIPIGTLQTQSEGAVTRRLMELGREVAAEHAEEAELIRQNASKFLKEMRKREG
jgi:hypothetical protein